MALPGDMGIDCVQLNYSFADQRAVRLGAIRRIKTLGIAVLARSVLGKGFLCSHPDFVRGRKESDHRNLLSATVLARFARARDRWLRLCREKKIKNLSGEAVSFVLRNPAVTAAIVGMLTARQVDENCGWDV